MCSEVIAKQECDICEGLQKKAAWETTNTQRMNQDFIICQTEAPGENVCIIQDFPSSAVVKNLPAMQETQCRRLHSLGQEYPLEQGMATHLQYTCKENSMSRGAWWATVHEAAKSRMSN